MPAFMLALASLPAASEWKDDSDDAPQFPEWSVPVILGPNVNSASGETGATISRDGLSLFFSSNRPGGFGDFDIWVCQRQSVEDPWGPAQNLGPDINTNAGENAPSLSKNGKQLFIHSNRPDGMGGDDIYVARRRNKRDDFSWRTPVNLGSGVNSSFNEVQASYFEDEETGTITLYFASDRPGGTGQRDLYASILDEEGDEEMFGPAFEVTEVNSSIFEFGATVRRDGLEMILGTFRLPSTGNVDLWVTTRARTSDPWSTPANLGVVINSVAADNRPALNPKGNELYFQSQRAGGFGLQDLYMSTRSKLRHRDDDD
jgi:hypothetical protein